MSVGTLIDSNVILDILTDDPTWAEWSIDALARVAESGPVYINPVIYAEVSIRFTSVEDLDEALPPIDFQRRPLPWASAFLAGKAFLRYRRNGGTRPSTLPDFFIGAHAAVADLTLVTRDVGRYQTYFPTVELVTPA